MFTRHMDQNMPFCSSFGNLQSFLLVVFLLHLVATTKGPQDAIAEADNSSVPPDIVLVRQVPSPCACIDGQCACCTGFILGQLGYNVQQRACMNVTYDPDDFTFKMVLAINKRVLYKNTLSGKNPAPVCVPVPRVPSIKLCAVFSNVYFTGRNLHMCIDMEGRWKETSVFKMSYDCIRIGANGVVMLKPEDGGGLPHGTFFTGDEEEDYDNVEEEEDDV